MKTFKLWLAEYHPEETGNTPSVYDVARPNTQSGGMQVGLNKKRNMAKPTLTRNQLSPDQKDQAAYDYLKGMDDKSGENRGK